MDEDSAFTLGAATTMAYLVSLHEPLLAPSRAQELWRAMERTCAAGGPRATRVLRLLVGVASDVAATLPPRDGWRNLAGRLGGLEVGDPPTGGEGAWSPTGQPFGTWMDAEPLVSPAHLNIDVDCDLAALATPLEAAAAAVLAAVGHGTEHGLAMLGQVPVLGRFAALDQALRWLIWRRRAYAGHEDRFALISGSSWVRWSGPSGVEEQVRRVGLELHAADDLGFAL